MSKISVGLHGEKALEAMFRLGGVSADQLAEVSGVPRRTASSTLRMLENSGLADKTSDLARWQGSNGGRPPAYYYLSDRRGGKGITYGGYLAGVERDREAKQGYRLHQFPARAAHSSLRNGYYLRVRSEAPASVTVPWDSMWGESHPEHPILAQEVDRGKAPRENARKSYKRLYPDGSFELFYGSAPGESTTIMVEVETQTRKDKIRSKLNDYAGWMRRTGFIRPLIIMGRTDSQAKSMRRSLREGIRERSEDLGEYIRYAEELGERVHLGRHVLVASSESIASRGAYSTVYRPLAKYEDERTYVGLLDAARLAGEAREALIEKETV